MMTNYLSMRVSESLILSMAANKRLRISSNKNFEKQQPKLHYVFY